MLKMRLSLRIFTLFCFGAAAALLYYATAKSPPQILSPSPTAPIISPVASNELQITELRLPPISLQEFPSANVIKTLPAHGAVQAIADLKAIRLVFSKSVAPPSKIIVLAGNKTIASGGEILTDKKTLELPISAGAFQARTLEPGIWEVYYDACFAGDTCYKGQFAFYGIP